MALNSRWVYSFSIFIFFFFWSLFPCLADLATDTIYLTWQRSPDTTMTIQWISPADQDQSPVLYRSKEETGWRTENGIYYLFPQTSNYFIHHVELQGLKPDSEYVFKISVDSPEFLFKTMPSQLDKPIRFVVGGDMYHDGLELLSATNKQAALFNPSFAVVGGDIAYASGSRFDSLQKVDRWMAWVKAWHKDMVTPQGYLIPVIAAIGNHDVSGNYNQTPAQARIFSLLFPMPGFQIYNAIDFGSYLSIILLDSGHANPIAGKQTEWLKNTLGTRQNVTNLFAVYHVPAYSSIRSFNGRTSMDIRRYWVPLFEKGRIQTVFEHHDHAYKRTYPLLNNKVDPNGIIYLGDGAWGVAKPRIPKASRPKRFYIAKFASKRHFIGVTLQKEKQTFVSIDPEGNLIDEYVRSLVSKNGEKE
ncbi:MAG: fibronectin type III domain-containing protein [Chlamydiales bacterium]